MSDELHPLRTWLKAHHLKQKNLAVSLGVTASMISQIVLRRKYPSRMLAKRIRAITQIPICRLYDMPDPACQGNGGGVSPSVDALRDEEGRDGATTESRRGGSREKSHTTGRRGGNHG